jgi:predicted GH43/DUF377 family glycosyl hydrolase
MILEAVTSELKLKRLGMLMEPEPGNPLEVEGVLNPAAARGPDGELYLFPRMTAQGNYSRIGIARVRFNADGDPAGVERLGIALEPEADYEKRSGGGGGCEDPRIALALSKDLFHWQRMGLATFGPYNDVEFSDVDDKDASIFPLAIPNPSGKPELAILHRPLFPGTRPEETACRAGSCEPDIDRESIWISYCPMALNGPEPGRLNKFTSHHRLAVPVSPWERLKIGGGAPPVLTRHGWLILYHGVHDLAEPGATEHKLCYSAGLMVLSKEHPEEILYRSTEPVLTPSLPQECHGTVANVVFPSGIDRRDDLGLPDRFDVYYGMADNRVGVARLDLPEFLP